MDCRGPLSVVLMLALTIMGLAPAALALAAAPGTPGMARIWIYRDYQPYQTLARPYVRLNGAIAGISEPGGAFYRDVPPSVYHIEVESYCKDFNQSTNALLVAGEEAYVKIESLHSWNVGLDWETDTFVVVVMEPDRGRSEIRSLAYESGD